MQSQNFLELGPRFSTTRPSGRISHAIDLSFITNVVLEKGQLHGVLLSFPILAWEVVLPIGGWDFILAMTCFPVHLNSVYRFASSNCSLLLNKAWIANSHLQFQNIFFSDRLQQQRQQPE